MKPTPKSKPKPKRRRRAKIKTETLICRSLRHLVVPLLILACATSWRGSGRYQDRGYRGSQFIVFMGDREMCKISLSILDGPLDRRVKNWIPEAFKGFCNGQ